MHCPPVKDLQVPPKGKSGWPWTEGTSQVHGWVERVEKCPRISIVTPSFNQGQFIEGTIRSVLLQGYPNLEYIIIDGGSKDGSVEIIKRYEPWVSYWVSEPDRGQSHALNKGFARSTGQVMGYLNSDDMLTPGALWKIASVFREGAHWVTARARVIDASDSAGTELRPVCRNGWAFWLTGFNWIPQPATFWSRKAFSECGEFREDLQFIMDYDYWIRLSLAGYRLSLLRDVLAYCRTHSQAKGTTMAHLVHEEGLRICSEYCSRLSPLQKRLLRYANMFKEAFRNLSDLPQAGKGRARGPGRRWLELAGTIARCPRLLTEPLLWKQLARRARA